MRRRKSVSKKIKKKKGELFVWKSLKAFLNSQFQPDSTCYISRKELVEHLIKNRFDKVSVDTYRNYLTQAGYMVRVSWGMYRIVKLIEPDLTLKVCKEKAYSHLRKILETKDDFPM